VGTKTRARLNALYGCKTTKTAKTMTKMSGEGGSNDYYCTFDYQCSESGTGAPCLTADDCESQKPRCEIGACIVGGSGVLCATDADCINKECIPPFIMCGKVCINPRELSCCNNSTPYNPKYAFCCNGKVVDQPYTWPKKFCCGSDVGTVGTQACCNNKILYNLNDQGCCGGVIYTKGGGEPGLHDTCCDNKIIKVGKTGQYTGIACCSGKVVYYDRSYWYYENDILVINPCKKPSIHASITSPSGGETWAKGGIATISWVADSESAATYVDIKLESLFANEYYTIAEQIEKDTGMYSWLVGNVLEDSMLSAGNYTIQICDSGTSICVTGSPFTITSTSTSVGGVCGSANRKTFSSMPTTNLCSSGTASTTSCSQSVPVNCYWTCVGSNGVSSASCSASVGNYSYNYYGGADKNSVYGNCNLSSYNSGEYNQVRNKMDIVREAISGSAQYNLSDISQISVVSCVAYNGGGGSFITTCPSGTNYAYCVKNQNDGVGNSVVLGVTNTSVATHNECNTQQQCVSVSGTGTNQCSTDSDCAQLTITASCSASPNPCMVNQPVVWSATATGGSGNYRYGWSGAGLAIAVPSSGYTTQTTNTLPSMPGYWKVGTYTATVTVTDSFGANASANCSVSVIASPLISGVCGSANGEFYTSAPTTDLCLTGTASTVSSSGSWNWAWTCAGSGGGATASCSAHNGYPLYYSGGTDKNGFYGNCFSYAGQTSAPYNQVRSKMGMVEEALQNNTQYSASNVSQISVVSCQLYNGSGGSYVVACPSGTNYTYCVQNKNDGMGNSVVLGVTNTGTMGINLKESMIASISDAIAKIVKEIQAMLNK